MLRVDRKGLSGSLRVEMGGAGIGLWVRCD
jgi:hypothetical protein